MAPGSEVTYLYIRWTIESEETEHQSVALSHKWTQRPLTLDETQMTTPSWVWPRLLEADIFLHSEPSGSWKEAWYSHFNLAKQRSSLVLCLPPPTPFSKPKGFANLEQRSSGAPAPASESGAGPSLAQPLGLAQGFLRCSKAPEHASETPSFTAWLAGPHTHTQLNRMLQPSSSNRWRTRIAPNY